MTDAVTRRVVLASAIAGAVQLTVAARSTATPIDSAFGTDLPGIVTTVPAGSGPTLELTFDACGGPGGSDVDVALLDLLLTHHIPATLFLKQRWIHANLELTHTLAADPLFVVANHGTRHVPLSVTGRAA